VNDMRVENKEEMTIVAQSMMMRVRVRRMPFIGVSSVAIP